jgi:aminomethyltransferase
MKRTPLYDQHVRDASMVINLKGFARAMQYDGHAVEHRATRESASLCDVSHMGELEFKGPDALALVQKIITNDAGKLAVNQALYSAMCDERGILLDDLVCFRLGADHFVWVVNVTKTDDDYQWVLKHAKGMDVEVKNISIDTALLALQGPASREVLQRITKADLAPLQYYWLTQTVIHTEHAEVACMISRTGYTGELGYEIMVARDLAPWVWDALLMVGRPLGIVSQGVAARESLRTEAGYLLNGNDMDAQTNPIEAGLGWVVKRSKNFIGRDALTRMRRRRRREEWWASSRWPRRRSATVIGSTRTGRTWACDERSAVARASSGATAGSATSRRGFGDRHRARDRTSAASARRRRSSRCRSGAPGEGRAGSRHVVAVRLRFTSTTCGSRSTNAKGRCSKPSSRSACRISAARAR